MVCLYLKKSWFSNYKFTVVTLRFIASSSRGDYKVPAGALHLTSDALFHRTIPPDSVNDLRFGLDHLRSTLKYVHHRQLRQVLERNLNSLGQSLADDASRLIYQATSFVLQSQVNLSPIPCARYEKFILHISPMHYDKRRTFVDFIHSFFSGPSFISRDIEQAQGWYHRKGNEMNFTEKN